MNTLFHLWHKITAPVVPLNVSEQRYAQLLASVVVALTPPGIIQILSTEWNYDSGLFHHIHSWHMALLLLTALLLTYYFSRTGHHRLGANLLVISSASVIYTLTVVEKEIDAAVFLLFPIAISMLFYKRRTSLITFSLTMLGVAALLFLIPGTPWKDLLFGSFSFLLFTMLLLSVTSYYHAANAKERQQQVEEKEDRYRRLVESLPALVLVHSGGPITYINPAGARMLGATSPDEIIGKKTVMDFLHPVYIDVTRERIKTLLIDQREVGLIEENLIRLDGKSITAEVTAIPFVYQGQAATQFVAYDITDRKQTENALRHSEAKNKALLSALPDLMFQMDRDGHFLDYYDPGAGLHVPADQFLNRPIQAVLPSIADVTLEKIQQALQTREVQEFVYDLPVGDEVRHYEARLVASSDQEVVSMVRDTTERTRAEEGLRRRDAILDALAYVSEQLLRSSDLEVTMPLVLAQLGQAARVSRAYIFRNHREQDGDLHTSQIYEWTVKGQISQLGNPMLVNVPYQQAYKRWESILGVGQPLFGLVRNLPADERAILEEQRILSFLVMPIFVGDDWWGFLGFDDCVQERQWLISEIEALRYVAATLGAALTRQRIEAAERDQRAFSEALQTAAAAINSTLQLDELLERILSSLSSVVSQDAASIMLFEGSTARIVGSRGYAEHEAGSAIDDLRLELSKSNCLHQIIMSGNSIIIGNTSEHPDWQDIPASRWVRSHLGVPIRQNGSVIGVINTDSATPYTYTAKHAAQLQTFADHAAIAIRNAQLFTAEQEQRALSEALQTTAAILNESLQLNEVLDRVLTGLSGVVPHEASCILMFDQDEAYVVGSRGFQEHGGDISHIRFKIKDAVNLSTTAGGTDVFVATDVRDLPNWVDVPESRWIRSHLQAPIRIDGKVIGVINLDSSTIGMFTERHGVRLQAFADHAAIAIRNAQLFDAEREQRALAEALRDMAELLNSTLDLDEVLDRILTNLGRVAPYDAANIMLLRNGVAQIVRQQNYDRFGVAEAMQSETFPADKFATFRQMIETQQPIVIRDTHAYPEWTRKDSTRWQRAYAAAPIVLEGEVIGFLNADSTIPGTYSAIHAERLQAFANQAAVAIRNAQLFATEREQRAISEALRDTAAAINASLELDEVLDRILTNIGRVVPHDAANIMLLRSDQVFVARCQGYDDYGTGDWMRALEISIHERPRMRAMAEQGKATVVFDTQLTSDWIRHPNTDWIRSNISAPIIIEERMIGFLNLDSAAPGAFSPMDAEQLMIFAEQAGVAIKNARLYERLIRYNEELITLYRSTSFLFASLPMSVDLVEFTQQIADVVVREFGKTDCGVMLLNKTTGELKRLARAGEYLVDATAPLRLDGIGLVPAAVRTSEVIYSPDVTQDERYFPSDYRTRSELVVPLPTAQGVIGVLDLQSTQTHAFSEQDIRLITAFAERAAAAIENRQLYTEIHRYTTELEERVIARTVDLSVRNAVATTLSSSLDAGAMLNGVLQTTVEQIGVMGGAIYLLTADASSLELAAYMGVEPAILQLVTGIAPNGSETGPTINENQSIREQTGISAVLSVPIWRQEQIQGIITLVHGQPRPWRNEEIRMLDAIGRQIGVALANAQLYSEAARGEAQVRAILQSVADGLLVFDQDGQLILMNPAAEALFAFYPEGATQAACYLWDWLQHRDGDTAENIEFALPVNSLIGDSVQNIYELCVQQHCLGTDRSDPGWPCWLQNEGSLELQVRLCPVYQRIQRRAVQAHSAQVRDSEGGVLGNVIALHDVTYYRELDELKGRFVSTVSHELRTPLSTIMLQVSTLQRYYDRIDDASRRDMVSEIQQQANVLRELIEDILELSRFDAKRSMPQKQWLDVDEQCNEGVRLMRTPIQEKHLHVEVLHDSGSRQFYADPNQFARAFRNLFSNAVKYTPVGGQVIARIRQVENELHISVEDTGIGISPEDQPYVFDRFFRSETASRMASGTGLGLAITKEIVDLHQGRVELSSQLGVGSIFTLCLPILVDDPEAHENSRLLG